MFDRGAQCPSEGVGMVSTRFVGLATAHPHSDAIRHHGGREWPWNSPSVAMFALTRANDRRVAWLNQFQ
jgi:hypothetical protein